MTVNLLNEKLTLETSKLRENCWQNIPMLSGAALTQSQTVTHSVVKIVFLCI